MARRRTPETPETQPGERIRIVVSDRDALVRAAVMATLRTEPTVVAEAATGDEGKLLRVIAARRPDVLLLGVAVVDRASLGQRLRGVHDACPTTRVLVLTGDPNPTELFEALCDGVDGYLSYRVDTPELIKAVRAVHGGRLWVERRLITQLRKIARPPGRASSDPSSSFFLSRARPERSRPRGPRLALDLDVPHPGEEADPPSTAESQGTPRRESDSPSGAS